MIVIADLHMSERGHAQVNAALNRIFSGLFPDESFCYFASADQIESVCSINFEQTNIEYFTIPIPIVHSSAGQFFRLFKDLVSFNRVIKTCFNKKSKLLLLYGVSPVSRFFIFRFKKIILGRQITILNVYHGELESLLNKKNVINPFKIGFWTRKALQIKDKKIVGIVLGDSILDNLNKRFPVHQNIISILHPYIYPVRPKSMMRPDCFSLGTPGVADESKNSHYIFQLAKIIKAKDDAVKFALIGKSIGMEKYDNGFVEYFKTGELLKDEDYETKVADLDFCLFFYTKNMYKLIASGALFDAIKFNKPIIALRNDYFEYVFSICGPLGVLCNDLDEMSSIIMSFTHSNRDQEIETFINNIESLKKFQSLDCQVNELRKKLRTVYI